MNPKLKITLEVVAIAALALLVVPSPAIADDVPDGLLVGWKGKELCQKLSEDAQVRLVRCTLPPGTAHVCHSHPAYISYVLSGGKAELQDEKGTRRLDLGTGTFADRPPTAWHEVANVGETTLQFLIVEKKYQPAPRVSQSVCPKRRSGAP
jgi:quercetin dioxygenase-like cupin family protein